MHAWLPYSSPEEAARRLGDIPDGVSFDCYPDADAPVPDSVTDLGFLVLPYLSSDKALREVARMDALQVVQSQTAGVDDLLARVPPTVTLCNAAGVHDTGTAELAIALVLASGRRLDVAARHQLSGTWDQQWGTTLADRHVVIVGYGRIGAAIERRLAGFEVDRVTRIARRARPATETGPEVLAVDQLDAVLPTADIVVLVMPHTPATDRLFDARRLALLPDGALLVNVGRGRLVDTDALVAATRDGRIRAAVDVVDPEPLPADHPLWHSPGVLISPHVGGACSAFHRRSDALISAQLRRWAAGEPLANVVAR